MQMRRKVCTLALSLCLPTNALARTWDRADLWVGSLVRRLQPLIKCHWSMASAAPPNYTHTACVLTEIKLVAPELKSGAPFAARPGHTGALTKPQSPLAQIDLEKNQSAGGELFAGLHLLISRVPLHWSIWDDVIALTQIKCRLCRQRSICESNCICNIAGESNSNDQEIGLKFITF